MFRSLKANEAYTEYLVYELFYADTPATETYSLSLHDALPILKLASALGVVSGDQKAWGRQWRITEGSGNVGDLIGVGNFTKRSEEQTSDVQSREKLVCGLLLAKNSANSTASEYTETIKYGLNF